MNALRLHLDEDADAHALVNGLRYRGWDVTSSRECRLLQRSDEDQLKWATEHGRTLFTYNVSDFCRLHSEYLRQGRHHGGITVGDQQTISTGEELQRLIRIREARTGAEMKDSLEFLSNWRKKSELDV